MSNETQKSFAPRSEMRVRCRVPRAGWRTNEHCSGSGYSRTWTKTPDTQRWSFCACLLTTSTFLTVSGQFTPGDTRSAYSNPDAELVFVFHRHAPIDSVVPTRHSRCGGDRVCFVRRPRPSFPGVPFQLRKEEVSKSCPVVISVASYALDMLG